MKAAEDFPGTAKSDEALNLRKVQASVDAAIRRFLESDADLLRLDASERSVSHKFAEHLQREFRGWDVDCEYNRKMGNSKRWPRCYDSDSPAVDDDDGKTVFPDIIVHSRETDRNQLVVEIKKSSNTTARDNDIKKLRYFTDPDEELQYRWGLFLEFVVGQHAPGIPTQRWFSKGEEIRAAERTGHQEVTR